MADVQLPSSDDSERAILGGVLVDNAALDELRGVLEPEHFHRRAYAETFAAMLELVADKTPVDTLTLVQRLGGSDTLEALGGAAGVSQLMDGIPRLFNVPHYARIVRDHAQRRRLIRMASELQRWACDPSSSPAKLAEQLEADARSVGDASASGFRFPTIADAAERFVTDAEERQKRGRGSGIKSGIRGLDDVTGGFDRGELVVIGAGTSVGKSALGAQVAMEAAKRGGVALIVSLEMSPEALAGRELCGVAAADGFALRAGRSSAADVARVRSAVEDVRMYGRRVAVADLGCAATVSDIRAAARALRLERGRLDVVVVDYLQLLRGGNFRSEYERITANSAELKAMALELGTVVLALSQLNREQGKEGKAGEAGRALRLSDLRGSGQVEQDADQVLLLRRPGLEKRQRGEAEVSPRELAETVLTVAKNRNGDCGTVELRFNGSAVRFEDAPSGGSARSGRAPF